MTEKIHPLAPMPLLAEPPPWNTAEIPVWETMGHSVLGASINLYHPRQANLLAVGGVHGDESEAIFLAHLLMGAQQRVPVLPCLNPDGALLRQRWNRRNVDLNRNLPAPDWSPEAVNPRYPPGTEPASEPETKSLLAALERVKPSTVLSLHSFKETFVEIERPPQALPGGLNEAVDNFVRAAGIERRLSVGYPTPGALGAYGLGHGLLIVTYELRRGASHAELHELLPALLELVNMLGAERFVAEGG